MKKLTFITAIILSVLCFIGGACFYLYLCCVLAFPCGPVEDFMTTSEEPMTLEEARGQLRIPLPDAATNIMYAKYAQWIALEFMLKFEAPPEVCKAHALALLEWHNEEHSRPYDHVGVALGELHEPPEPVPNESPLNAAWFDIHNIKNGFVGGSTGSHKPMIWVDTDRGILYYRMTD